MTRTVRIGSVAGLHARSAARVAAAAASLPERATVRMGDRVVPADSVLGLLSLAATYGTELILVADGAGAAETLAILAGLLADDLDAARA
ncbi:MAG: phosphocarrier protein HPr [Actinoplanes sp.]|jgi:phosphocarrier protein|nr:phosphocarrier protein HPr [Actinoplanes sp.]